MRPIFRPAVAAASFIVLSACGSSSAPVSDDGWISILDGSTLDYVNILGDANWRIEDGAAVADASSAASFLVTPDAYTDFELDLEFWVNTEANSGIFLRCQNPEAIADSSCYEVNIYDTRADQTYRTGGVVNFAEPAEFVYTGGQWNRYQISMVGDHLQVSLNGRAMVDMTDSTYASGPVALQYGTGIVRFRNVRIRPQ